MIAWQHALRWLWNLGHEQRVEEASLPPAQRRMSTFGAQDRQLSSLRASHSWFADVPYDAASAVLKHLDMAWQRYSHQLAGHPRFKKRGDREASIHERSPRKWHILASGDAVVFPKLGVVSAVIHRPVIGVMKTCTLVRDVDQWFACIVCELDEHEVSPPDGPPIAIDRGVVNLIADSTGRRVENPQCLRRQARRLAHAQRVVARRKKGSKNQQKAKIAVAQLQRKIRRQRDHVLHRESHRYAKSHSVVVIEKLEVRNMTRSARGTVDKPGTNVRQKTGLNRAILDVGWARLGGMLRYKCAWSGAELREVAAQYSSQTCAACFVVNARSRRSQSEFECVSCGHRDHADVNAARVLLSRGSHGDAVCGGYGEVSRPTKQKLRVARRGPCVFNAH